MQSIFISSNQVMALQQLFIPSSEFVFKNPVSVFVQIQSLTSFTALQLYDVELKHGSAQNCAIFLKSYAICYFCLQVTQHYQELLVIFVSKRMTKNLQRNRLSQVDEMHAYYSHLIMLQQAVFLSHQQLIFLLFLSSKASSLKFLRNVFNVFSTS